LRKKAMADSEIEIVVDDPTAPASDSPAVTSTRTVEMIACLALAAFAALMAWDNWRTGMSWASDGPKAGYFPFYLSVILGAAGLYGFVTALLDRAGAGDAFVSRDQLRRVLQVFVPTCVFCVLMQWLGLYVASLLLVAGFMRWIGRIAWWKSLLTSFIFAATMFVTFDIAFDVIMPKGPLEAAFGY
jgi:putative tricarboxylic transport membrane protein